MGSNGSNRGFLLVRMQRIYQRGGRLQGMLDVEFLLAGRGRRGL